VALDAEVGAAAAGAGGFEELGRAVESAADERRDVAALDGWGAVGWRGGLPQPTTLSTAVAASAPTLLGLVHRLIMNVLLGSVGAPLAAPADV